MNLESLFRRLSPPQDASRKVLNAISIPEFPPFRIAVNYDGHPVLLISVLSLAKDTTVKNRRLKYLRVEQSVECQIRENSRTFLQTCTLITFTSSEPELHQYFLQIAETFIRSAAEKSTEKEIIETLDRFIEIFRVLSEPPINTVQGLWAELFLIESSDDPKTLLSYWHNFPEEKFDFDGGNEKIEVKSTSGSERIHEFSAEQLNSMPGTQILIASLFTRQASPGKSIQDLMQSISSRSRDDNDLLEKMNIVVSKTLGNSLEQSINSKFDYELSKMSLRFYKDQDISKVEDINIPNEVSNVRYRSDLSSIRPVEFSALEIKGKLFKAICNGSL